jgi:VWA domain-containing protein/aerotolerance regulator-like protein
MSLLSPLALLGLAFIPAVIAMYLLKLRRDERVVSSTLLWQKLVADVEANAPWQRLRRSLLLLLQLLLVLLLVLLAARPFLERPAGLARDLVVVIDTSASMAATDVLPDRLTAAKAAVLDALRDLPTDGRVSVIAAGRTPRVVANGTTDLGRIRAAIDAIAVSPAPGDLGQALALADALASRAVNAEVLVATDAALAVKPTTPLEHPVKVLQVGRERRNQAIVALAVRPAPSGVTRSVFASVANLDIEPVTRRLELYGDGVLLEARDVFLDPQTRSDVIVDDVPRAVGVIEVRLTGTDPDQLALDDHAWAVVPAERLRRVLLVSDGDPYLETALTYLPNTELYGVTPAAYGPATHPELFDLVIFEGALPSTIPDRAVLAIAPTASSVLGQVTGALTDPGIGSLGADEPILRYVDLSTTHIGKAVRLETPTWARTVIPGPAGAPLLYVGEQAGRRAGVLAFLPRQSDLPLQVAFPILIANLAGELLGGSAAPTAAVSPGDPVTLPLPSGAVGLHVTRPDGTTVDLAPGTPGAPTVAYSQTEQLGVYSATPILGAATPGPSSNGGASPGAAASAVPGGASPTPGVPPTLAPGASPTPVPTAPPVDPNAPVQFAVDLFDPNESNIAPGSASAIEALGNGGPRATAGPGASGAVATPTPAPTAAASRAPGASGGTGATTDERPSVTRDELWLPIAVVALTFLMVEWLVYHRDTVLRLWRGVTGRRGPAAPTVGRGR